MKIFKITAAAMLLFCTLSTAAQTRAETLEWLQQYGNDYCRASFKNESGFLFNYAYTFLPDAVIEKTSGDFKINTKIYYKDMLYTDTLSETDLLFYGNYSPPVTMIRIPVQKKYRLIGMEGKERLTEEPFFYLPYVTNTENDRQGIYKVLQQLMRMAKLSGAQPYEN